MKDLNTDFANLQKSRRSASSALRKALSNASQLRLEKEKNKTPSCAMRISMKISKVVWSMLADGNTFAEAEINDMVCVLNLSSNYFVVKLSGLSVCVFCLLQCFSSL